jgi:hypothetical protein
MIRSQKRGRSRANRRRSVLFRRYDEPEKQCRREQLSHTRYGGVCQGGRKMEDEGRALLANHWRSRHESDRSKLSSKFWQRCVMIFCSLLPNS